MSKFRIILMSSQYSVVVRGIENKLNDVGFDVTIIEDKIAKVKEHLELSDLFVVNLPIDADTGSLDYRELLAAIKILNTNNKKMILIGEKRERDIYISNCPIISDLVWINRPIDADLLVKNIDEALGIDRDDIESEAQADADKSGDESGDGSGEADEGQKKVQNSILIVDDDPAYAKMVREWIKDTYKVSIVTAGMQAIKFLMKNKVDLILLDYEMPVADGPMILEMLKSDPETADIPVVFLTGIGTKESLVRVASLKPAGYILKSNTRENLLKYINGFFTEN